MKEKSMKNANVLKAAVNILKVASALFLMVFNANTASAQDEVIKEHIVNEVSKWIGADILIKGINSQNSANAALTQADIDSQDKNWRAEVKSGGGAMTSKVLANGVSSYLKDILQKSEGLYSEIFVMDNKGLNVGQSDLTSDYWQGDEAKWQKTYPIGKDAIHIGEVEFDESSQTYQVQVSLSITDPANGQVIGAITIGMNAELIS